eukprot:3320410-Amphidinium_carterae.1
MNKRSLLFLLCCHLRCAMTWTLYFFHGEGRGQRTQNILVSYYGRCSTIFVGRAMAVVLQILTAYPHCAAQRQSAENGIQGVFHFNSFFGENSEGGKPQEGWHQCAYEKNPKT